MTIELVNVWGEVSSLVVKDRLPVERVNPLQTGDRAPEFSIAKHADYWTTPVDETEPIENVLTMSQLIGQGPVVIGFYCPCWGRYASPFLDAFIKLSQEVQRAGGQFVVFSNEHPKYLPQSAAQAPITLVYDVDKTVAQQFGVYSEADPIWDRVSGISEEVYIPALYVADETGQVRYHFLDENFEGFSDYTTLYQALFQ